MKTVVEGNRKTSKKRNILEGGKWYQGKYGTKGMKGKEAVTSSLGKYFDDLLNF